MPIPTINGSLLPYLQWSERDFDPQRGFIYRYFFKGASQFLMQGLQADYVRNGIACRIHYEKDTATLDVEDSTQANPIDIWQIIGNEEQRDALSHPELLDILTDDQISDVRNELGFVPATTPNDLLNMLVATGLDATDAATVARFYALQRRGQTDYRRQQYVLRHTTNAPSGYAVNVADVGVDHIYTVAQLLTEVQNSNLWVVPLPNRLAFKISNIPVPIAQPNYLWGWLKGASTETSAANNRIEIQTEYVLEQWSTDYYQPF